MDLKGIVVVLVALGGAFFYLSGNQSTQLGDMSGLLGGVQVSDGADMVPQGDLPKRVFTATGEMLPISQFVDGFDKAAITGLPAKLALLPKDAGCVVTSPSADQRLSVVQLADSDINTSVYAYDNTEFARSAAYELDRVYSRGSETITTTKKLSLGPMSPYTMELVNVIVPPGDKPAYLVLQSEGAQVLWNILPMPGAKVAHVTLLVQGSGGVVNLPEGAKLEVPDIISGACGEFRRPVENPKLTEERGFVPSDETRAEYIVFYGWYLNTFGKPPTEGVIRREQMAGVLAGDLPPEGAAKAAWRAVEGQTIHVLPRDNIYAVGEKEHEDWFTAKTAALIADAFSVPEGSDILAAITPVMQERTN